MSELVLMIPKDKKPYIGIRLISGRLSVAEEDFFRNIENKEVKIVLEIDLLTITVKLICEEILKIYTFKSVKFNEEKLDNWQYIRNNREMNFGLTYLKNDKETILKYWNQGNFNAVCAIKELNIVDLRYSSLRVV